MSILIKGMELPKAEFGNMIVAIRPDGMVEDVMGCYVGKVIPVPPHGRMIDADKQDAQIEALIERHLHGYTKSTWDFVCELRDILKRNPTIIPAEEGE